MGGGGGEAGALCLPPPKLPMYLIGAKLPWFRKKIGQIREYLGKIQKFTSSLPPPPPRLEQFSVLAGIRAWIRDSGNTGKNVCAPPPFLYLCHF